MTDWTPEEEAVAKAIVEAASGPFNVLSVRGKETAIREARAAISAMQPRWRDVKTDPPPCDDTFALAYWRDGNMQVADFDHDSDPEWWIERGLTHWMPLPPAPEDKP